MALKSDAYGFLVGAPVEWGKAHGIWTEIRDEIRALRESLANGRSPASVVYPSAATATPAGRAKPAGSHTSMTRNASGRLSPAVRPQPRALAITQQPVPNLAKTEAALPRVKNDRALYDRQTAQMATGQPRDAAGRFTSGDAKPNGSQSRPDSESANPEGSPETNPSGDLRKRRKDEAISLLSRVVGRATQASSVIARAPAIDPTISAIKEIQSIASPVGRGMGKLFTRTSDRAVPWYRRILGELRGMRGDGSAFHKSELKTLKRIEERTAGRSGLGLFGGLAGGIPGLGMLGRLFGGLGALFSLGLMGGKGLLRRIPLLGGLLAGGSALYSLLGFGDDPNASADDNRKNRFKGGGAGVGALVGGGIGTLFGGPLGGMIGGVIGVKIGEKIGDWLSDVDWKDVADTFKAAIEPLGPAIKLFSEAATGLVALLRKFGFIDEPTPETQPGSTIAKGNGWFARAKNAVGDALAHLVGLYTGDPTSSQHAQGQTGRQSASAEEGAGGVLGNLIAKHEGSYRSFNQGAAGDSSRQGIDFSNLTIGEVMRRQALPKGDPARLFAVGRYQVIPSTLKGAAQALGLKGDEAFTPELQERIFSQYLIGMKNPKIRDFITGKSSDLKSAIKSGAMEWAAVADPDTGMSFHAGKGNNRASTSAESFGLALQSMRETYLNGIAMGIAPAQAYSRTFGPAAASMRLPSIAPIVASAPSVSVSPGVTPPKIPEAPAIASMMPISTTGKTEVRVGQETADVGQNLSNSKIARIATGGLGDW